MYKAIFYVLKTSLFVSPRKILLGYIHVQQQIFSY